MRWCDKQGDRYLSPVLCEYLAWEVPLLGWSLTALLWGGAEVASQIMNPVFYANKCINSSAQSVCICMYMYVYIFHSDQQVQYITSFYTSPYSICFYNTITQYVGGELLLGEINPSVSPLGVWTWLLWRNLKQYGYDLYNGAITGPLVNEGTPLLFVLNSELLALMW